MPTTEPSTTDSSADSVSDAPAASTPAGERICWCGSKSFRQMFQLKLEIGLEPAVCSCNGCGVVFLNPQPSDAQLLPYYDLPYYGSSRSKFVGPIARFVRWWQGRRAAMVSKRVTAPGSVLDVGCGNGQFLLDLHNQGFNVQGTELTAQSAARVPQEIANNIHVGDLLNLKLQADQYDALSMWHVLEHVRDPHAICCEIHHLLKPGGWVFLSLPNAQSTEATLFGKHWFHLDPPRHLFGLGTGSLNALLEQTGFEVVAVHTWSLEQNPYGFIQSFLNALGFKRDRAYDTLKGMHKGKPLRNAVDLVLLALLTPLAMIWSSVLSALGKGSTMTLVARKR